MSIFVCPECSVQIDTDFYADEIYSDGENDPICMNCHEDWVAKEYAHWKPVYDGEVLAGIAGPDSMTQEESRKLK